MSSIEFILSLISGLIVLQLQLVLLVKWLVKHYLRELIPNSGTSLKDQITRLEAKQHEIYMHFMNKTI
jgi:hypothetical protein